MTTTRTTAPSPIVGAAVLLTVLVLFAAGAFVAGVAVGRGLPPASDQPSATAAPTATPAPTPILQTVTCSAPSEAFHLLCETYARIKADYVDELDDADLVEGAVKGMVEALPDPYSGYLPPEQYETALDDLSGEFGGIGAEVGMRNLADPGNEEACTVITDSCALVIVAPLDGSPAEAAGLRSGDVVLAVDGTTTLGSTISDQVFRVRGEAGTEVTLTIERDGETLEVTITRAVIDLQEVSSEMLSDRIGYLRLTTFTDRSPELLRDALAGLLDAGATAIVFDLRDNPGGFLAAAQGVASEFVPAGELLFTVESGADVQRWESESGGLAQDASVEVVVLINGGSASASEIVAGALSETGRVTLVGEPTFGKNTVQVWSELPNGGGLRLTTDRWYTPSHRSAADGGIVPDVTVAAPADPQSPDDPQLDRAVELLGG
ncbi:MAG: S41 family peptidase [Nocardioidaceae bacterium]